MPLAAKGPALWKAFIFCSRAFHFYIESMERLYGLVFAAKRMVKVKPL